MKKPITPAHVDDLIRIRFGRPVTSPRNTAFVSYKRLARLVNMSSTTVRSLMHQRFEQLKANRSPAVGASSLVEP